MKSWYRNISWITGPLYGKPPATGGFPSQRVSSMDPWGFLWCEPRRAAEQSVELLMIRDAHWIRLDTIKFIWLNSVIVQQTFCQLTLAIGIDTKIEVMVVSPTTWEAHHSPRAKPDGCGDLPRSLVTPPWPKSRYQFLFYHDASKHIKFMQICMCIRWKSLIKLLQISHKGKHGHRPLSLQLP